jgi:hypothetical protein
MLGDEAGGIHDEQVVWSTAIASVAARSSELPHLAVAGRQCHLLPAGDRPPDSGPFCHRQSPPAMGCRGRSPPRPQTRTHRQTRGVAVPAWPGHGHRWTSAGCVRSRRDRSPQSGSSTSLLGGKRERLEQDFALYQSAIEVVRLTVADQSGNETFTVPMNETLTVPMMAP